MSGIKSPSMEMAIVYQQLIFASIQIVSLEIQPNHIGTTSMVCQLNGKGGIEYEKEINLISVITINGVWLF